MQEMTSVMNREFHELELDGSNYLSWAMDTKIALECRKLGSQLSHLLKAPRKYRKQPRLNFVSFAIRPFHFTAFVASYSALYCLRCHSFPL